jgi:hypothetical protein
LGGRGGKKWSWAIKRGGIQPRMTRRRRRKEEREGGRKGGKK